MKHLETRLNEVVGHRKSRGEDIKMSGKGHLNCRLKIISFAGTATSRKIWAKNY